MRARYSIRSFRTPRSGFSCCFTCQRGLQGRNRVKHTSNFPPPSRCPWWGRSSHAPGPRINLSCQYPNRLPWRLTIFSILILNTKYPSLAHYDQLLVQGTFMIRFISLALAIFKLMFLCGCTLCHAFNLLKCMFPLPKQIRSEVLCTKFDQRSNSELACSLLACLTYFTGRQAVAYTSTLLMFQRIN